MAFTSASFVPSSGQANSLAPRTFSYGTADPIATVKGANYFDLAVTNDATVGYGLGDGDIVTVAASDGTSLITIAVTGVAATTALALDFA